MAAVRVNGELIEASQVQRGDVIERGLEQESFRVVQIAQENQEDQQFIKLYGNGVEMCLPADTTVILLSRP